MLAEHHHCSICPRAFRRRAHLKRHVESHNSDRPYTCSLCDSAFKRADVLKRHIQTCDGNLTSTQSKRRACDRCVRQKKACNLENPCRNCITKDSLCSYSLNAHFGSECSPSGRDRFPPLDNEWAVTANPRPLEFVGPEATIASPSDPLGSYEFNDFSTFNLFDGDITPWKEVFMLDEGTFIPSSSSIKSYRKCFEFLDLFTRSTGFIQSFDCGTYDQRKEVLQQAGASLKEGKPEAQNRNNITVLQHALGSPLQPSPPEDPLYWRTHQIILLVREVVTVKPRNSIVKMSWSSALEAMCFHFFSPSNLQKFMNLFWAIWHPNVNFIHRPTFDPLGCKTILLASMALIGK